LGIPKTGDARDVLSAALHQYGRFERTQKGTGHEKTAVTLLTAAEAYRQKKKIPARSLAGLDAKLEEVSKSFRGDPRKDIEGLVVMLRANGGAHLAGMLASMCLRSPADAGPDLISKLAESYSENGYYRDSLPMAEASLLRERLLENEDIGKGRLITTLHKVKGKEFDAVVIVDGAGDGDKLLLRNDPSQDKSRRLLNVAITRARHQVVILTPVYDPCCLLPVVPADPASG
jgi:DNA helicase-2/ATP-dependent DNA helicase PcrA